MFEEQHQDGAEDSHPVTQHPDLRMTATRPLGKTGGREVSVNSPRFYLSRKTLKPNMESLPYTRSRCLRLYASNVAQFCSCGK
jgi:hypothetical protein